MSAGGEGGDSEPAWVLETSLSAAVTPASWAGSVDGGGPWNSTFGIGTLKSKD